jgi:hypothetical protein
MKTIREQNIKYKNPSICAWCGINNGVYTEKTFFLKKHYISGDLSTLRMDLLICPTCKVFKDKRIGADAKIQKWGYLVPTILGAVLAFLTMLSPHMQIFITLLVTAFGALIGLIIGLLLLFWTTKILKAVNLYGKLLNLISGTPPEGYACLINVPGEITGGDADKIRFYASHFHEKFSELNPDLVE